jgi:predicted ATPase/DNA-binding SARP family transcriptional activator
MQAKANPPGLEPTSGGLYIRLLGGFKVRLDGREVPDSAFARRKSKSLLKLLALQGGYRLHREQAIEALWPGLSPESGAAQLYKAVYQARRALLGAGSGIVPEEVLVVRGEELRLEAPDGVRTDVVEFEALAYQALQSRNPEEVERATQAYGGDLLPMDFYEEWTLGPREALRSRLGDLLLALGELRLERSAFPAASLAFSQALQLDPLLEAAHRGLMRVYACQGDRVGLERQYRRCAEAIGQALNASPSPQTTQLYQSLLENPPPIPSQAGPQPAARPGDRLPLGPGPRPPVRHHNLPAQPSPFVGRVPELAWIAERLGDPECRLLTLVGPGGVGKTRLGLQAAAERLEDFAGGVYFVPLAHVAGPESLLGAIAEALQLPLYPGSDPKVQLLERIKSQSVLLLLDNFEHLLGGVGLLTELLEAAPALKLLVTSRRALSLRSEWLFEVGGLDYPATAEGAQTYSAVRLFLQHLRRIRPGFTPGPLDLGAIVRICWLVEGFPLSLELAAAQGRVLSCSEIADEIQRGLGGLETTLHDLPARHRSQRAAFEPSWQSLSPHEQQVFAWLSVFRGGFRRKAAEEVAGATLAVLSSLLDKSLLRRTPTGRYRLHELLRQFGEEKLRGDPAGLETACERHARYYCEYLAHREARIKGPDHRASLGEIAEEIHNTRAALRHAAARGDLEMLDGALGAMWLFGASRGSHLWEEEGFFSEVIAALERQGLPAADRVLSRLRAIQGAMIYRLGFYERSRGLLEEVIAFLRQSKSASRAEGDLAFALHHLAAVTHLLGEYPQEQALLRESITLSRAVGDSWLTAYSLNDLGMATHLLGDDPEAERLCREGLRVFEELGDPRGKAYTLSNLGVITLALSRPEEAWQFHLAALTLAQENADRWAEVQSLLRLGDAAIARSQPGEARHLITEALRLAASERIPAVVLGALTRLAALREEQERALDYLALVLAHPATSREDWALARQLWEGLEAPSPSPLPAPEAAARLEALTAEILGQGG